MSIVSDALTIKESMRLIRKRLETIYHAGVSDGKDGKDAYYDCEALKSIDAMCYEIEELL